MAPSCSPAFEEAARHLEELSDLDRLQARGTLRIALKEAGLAAHEVSGAEMRVVVEKLLPVELDARGIAEADALCAGIGERLGEATPEAEAPSPASVFRRLRAR